jgi:16S rRNA (cytidine1402-2'-O)-methyltransferase
VLGSVRLIAAEDTRVTRRLLTRHGIKTPLVSHNALNERERLPRLLAALDEGDVAVVSDAGMPTVSDPGAPLVAAAAAAGHSVVPVPGASAVLAALAASGLGGGAFTFVGFLPRRGRERAAAIVEAGRYPHSIVLFESPHRLLATLRDLRAALGSRPAAAARELTKLHEQVVRGDLDGLVAHFEATAPRGEVTLVIGPPTQSEEVSRVSNDHLVEALRAALASGLKPRAAAAQVGRQTGRPPRELYQLLLGR